MAPPSSSEPGLPSHRTRPLSKPVTINPNLYGSPSDSSFPSSRYDHGESTGVTGFLSRWIQFESESSSAHSTTLPARRLTYQSRAGSTNHAPTLVTLVKRLVHLLRTPKRAVGLVASLLFLLIIYKVWPEPVRPNDGPGLRWEQLEIVLKRNRELKSLQKASKPLPTESLDHVEALLSSNQEIRVVKPQEDRMDRKVFQDSPVQDQDATNEEDMSLAEQEYLKAAEGDTHKVLGPGLRVLDQGQADDSVEQDDNGVDYVPDAMVEVRPGSEEQDDERDSNEDEEEAEDDDDWYDSKSSILHWEPGAGLRILTEEDLYDENPRIPSWLMQSEFEDEDTSEEELARAEELRQIWKSASREKTRMPLYKDALDQPQQQDDETCSFVSPVEAYQKALTRIRRTNQLKSQGQDPDLEEITIEDYYRFSHPDIASQQSPDTEHAHKYSKTGHLVPPPDAEQADHPIPQLLSLGERRWEEMAARQSRTLGEAVEEYKRRYSRLPPKGFDLWWDFASNNDVLLPDEYDRINLDLAPFWALPRTEMRKRVREALDVKETFVLVVEKGRVRVQVGHFILFPTSTSNESWDLDARLKQVHDQGGLDWGGTLPRARDAASLIRPFAKYMPDMQAVFSIHDQPRIYLSATRRASLIELGLNGERESDFV